MKTKKFLQIFIFLVVAVLMTTACGTAETESDTVIETVIVAIEGTPVIMTVIEGESQDSYSAPPSIYPTPSATQAALPAGMFFQDYGVNPFIDTEDDYLSTFGLDVDTGSYTLARRYINDGLLPPEDAIRTEEFINYFNQGYENPPEGQAFSINIDGAPSPFTETERYRMLRIGVQGYSIPPELRKDVALTFVIDVSGSMDIENRLELVKRSLELLVEQLRPTDSVGIVVYGSEARIVLEPTSGSDQEEILRAIYSLQPEGSTNAEAGLRLGYEQALKAFNPGGINRIVLCSDGVANVGRTGPDNIWDQVSAMASEGIMLTTIGFGMGNYNDVLMEQLADNGQGFYAYVDDIKEAERLFVHNLVSTLQVIALDAKIQVEFNPEVVSRYRLLGYENRAIADDDFRNDDVDAGEVGAGHSATALYEIKLHHEAQGRIATVHLRWEDPDTHEVIEIHQDFYASEMAETFSEADTNFQLTVLVAEFAEVLRGSYWAQTSSLDDVLEEAERIYSYFIENPEVEEFLKLARRAWSLAGS